MLSKLLSVPSLRARYLGYVRDIAEKWLDWNQLGPLATQYHALIADEVKADTRKLDSLEAFQQSLAGEAAPTGNTRGPGGGGSIKRFAEQRRAYLLKYRETPDNGKSGSPPAASGNSERPGNPGS